MSSMDERIISPTPEEDEAVLDQALRPQHLDALIGQDHVRANLSILIEAAKKRDEAIDHVLLYGPPGLGKTTLSHIIANEMDVPIRVTSGPAIERTGDLAAILSNLRHKEVFFIDEVHRLGHAVEEILYPAMEDFALDFVIGKGPSARSIRLNLPRFTVVGATTRLALLTAPLRSRFGATFRVDFYDQASLAAIVRRAARVLDVEIDEGGASEIARRGRGTPRVALRLLKRVRDYAQVRAEGRITTGIACQALELLNVDRRGLDDVDRRVLTTIIDKFEGGPVGLDTIAAAVSEESDTIMDVVEPYLLRLGFLDRTPRGRVATPRAYEHLDVPYQRSEQPSLL
ncbi:MAG: Holliday junction branch migration DNA helicase RuvB [Anaerolineae bacterium]|nr:Holliday junction branch migration DNA helicase RuvB [Anaerolineae bacterium]